MGKGASAHESVAGVMARGNVLGRGWRITTGFVAEVEITYLGVKHTRDLGREELCLWRELPSGGVEGGGGGTGESGEGRRGDRCGETGRKG